MRVTYQEIVGSGRKKECTLFCITWLLYWHI